MRNLYLKNPPHLDAFNRNHWSGGSGLWLSVNCQSTVPWTWTIIETNLSCSKCQRAFQRKEELWNTNFTSILNKSTCWRMEVGCIYCRIACKFKRWVSTIELLFVCVRQNRHFVCPFSECSSNCGFTATFKKHLRKSHDADIKYFDEESQQTQTGTKRPHGDDQMATSPENNEEDMLFNWTYCNTSEHKSSLRRRGPCCIRRSLRDRRRARTEDPFSALWQVASAGTITEDRLSTFHMLAGAQTVSQILTAQPKKNFECRLPCISQQIIAAWTTRQRTASYAIPCKMAFSEKSWNRVCS